MQYDDDASEVSWIWYDVGTLVDDALVCVWVDERRVVSKEQW